MWLLGKRMLKNTGGRVNRRIEDFRTALLELRKAFLDEATIATEITAFQILDGVGIISAKVDWIFQQRSIGYLLSFSGYRAKF